MAKATRSRVTKAQLLPVRVTPPARSSRVLILVYSTPQSTTSPAPPVIAPATPPTAAASSECIILLYETRTLLTTRPPTLERALIKAGDLFPEAEEKGEIYLTVFMEGLGRVEIVEDAWGSKFVQGDLRKIYVQVRQRKEVEEMEEMEEMEESESEIGKGKRKAIEIESDSEASTSATSSESETEEAVSPRKFRLNVVHGGRGDYITTIEIEGTTTFDQVFSAVTNALGNPDADYRLLCGNYQLVPDHTPELRKFRDEERILLVYRLRGGKPVILFYPTSRLPSVNVSLTLIPEWKFSAVYPLAPICPSENGISTVEWNVSASPGGTLVEKSTGTSTSYLFWEALALSIPPSPRLIPTDNDSNPLPPPSFDPSRPLLDATNSVLLAFPEFIPYLHVTLLSLSLTISAATDFMTYWLPHFLEIQARGESIAMRFVEQVAYEQAAILRIRPEPEVVTRTFMLFKRVQIVEEDMRWLNAAEVDWVEVVGVRKEAWDEDKFRVLEWGGMEVKS